MKIGMFGHPPSCPNGMNIHSLRNIDNQLDVGIVVVICATGNFNIVICHADIIGVCLEIFRRGHHCKLDGPFVAERLVCPFSYRPNFLYGSDAVVGNQYL